MIRKYILVDKLPENCFSCERARRDIGYICGLTNKNMVKGWKQRRDDCPLALWLPKFEAPLDGSWFLTDAGDTVHFSCGMFLDECNVEQTEWLTWKKLPKGMVVEQ